MRQILITPEIKAMAQEYANNLFKDKKRNFVQPVTALNNLIIDLKEANNKLVDNDKYVKYIKEIIKDFAKLKNLHPDSFDSYKTKYDGILDESFLSTPIKFRKISLPTKRKERKKLKTTNGVFYEVIVDRMRYDAARLYLGPYMKAIGINTCVYCNNTKATYSEKRKEVYYPFDHGKPKSKYPFLSICFYNLYPCCSNCNGHKLDDEEVDFQLYIGAEPMNDSFVFEIDRSKIEEDNPNTIDVRFKARSSVDDELAEKYDGCFRINDLYNSEDEKRSSYKMLKQIDKYRASYPAATAASVTVSLRKELFLEVLGVEDNELIYTDVNKKLKLDTAKDAKLI